MRIKKVTVSGWKSFETATLELARLNVLVGRNNSGKSALIRAIQFMQTGSQAGVEEIRLGSRISSFQYLVEDFNFNRYSPEDKRLAGATGFAENALIEVQLTAPTQPDHPWAALRYSLVVNTTSVTNTPQIPSAEPGNYIYPYLSKRKVTRYDRGVDRQKALQVSGNFQNLPAKVARLTGPGYPGGAQFASLCKRLLQLELGPVLVDNGALVGFTVGKLGTITIESMGEGVAGVLGLITDLCVAEDQLFLIEEPENDIHPEGLKALLDVIIEKSATNQFVVSTHSNIVVKYLASAPDSRLFSVSQHVNDAGLPTSTVKLIDSPEARSEVLRDLGYDLHDFDLAEGWLILEESSAERLIRDYLIPWFAPKLTRIRTVAARGTGEVEMTFREFAKLVLYVHREETLKHRAWVIVDGEPSGRDVAEKLRSAYRTWPADRFRCWSEEQFEAYYPAHFKDQVAQAFAQPKGKPRQEAKSVLRQQVQDWCDANPELAKAELESSAAEIIGVLREIEAVLNS